MNLNITQRLVLLSASSILSLLLVSIAGYFAAHAPQKSLAEFQTNIRPSLALLNEVERDFLVIRRLVAVHVLELYDPKKMDDEAAIKSARERIEANLDLYAKRMKADAQNKKLLEDERQQIRGYDAITAQVLEMSRAYDTDAARDLFTSKGVEQGTRVSAAIKAHREYNDQLGDQSQLAAAQEASLLLNIAWAVSALAVVLTGTLALLLIRSIRESLSEVQQTVEYIETRQDFTRRVRVIRQDELGATASAVNRLIEKLQGNLQTIAAGAHTLAASASQMASTSTHVANASSQQSAAASDMAATVEEMTVSINHVADRAQEANTLSSESGQLAANGEQVIGQTVSDINDIAGSVHDAAERIHELDHHGKQIASVVAVIKEVADQTNLLALNAAIEAARAGEQGRGFAVVADEVRKLAERTAKSTQEIEATINAMQTCAGSAVGCMQEAVRRVNTGVSGAQEANQAIQQIRAGSQQAVQRVEEIASAIREQGAATNSIAAQVEKIAQMSEESNASAEESADAAQSLDRLAKEMHGIVSAYRL
ncbi:methyl-accepting chemotaxis protein [Uliginosibacterium flavum]|uniref:Methyl-accepting chemotaxis protein n=1 Tax=Uliginosibacterium flavum TaxID=1396831 RepID=A0ABV2TH76_9RHOO